MLNGGRAVWLALSSGAFFFLIQALISYAALSSVSSLRITLEIDHPDSLEVYYAVSPKAGFNTRRGVRTEEVFAESATQIRVSLRNRIARYVRLDPGYQSGVVKFHRLEFRSRFAPPIVMDGPAIQQRFLPNKAISGYELEGQLLRVEISGEDPKLILREPLVFENRFLSLVLPLAFTLAFFLAIAHFSRQSFPAFYDLSHHYSSANINYAALDGVRGIAVLLVLADHSWGAFTGAGVAGVWIFFVLSGFLLAIPFTRDSRLAVSKEYMGEYLLRRLKRIIPMYYAFLAVALFFQDQYGSAALRHLLFLQGDGHLWTIPQEMLFYLILPLIVLTNHVLLRGRAIWIVVLMTLLMLLLNRYLDTSVVHLYGQDSAMRAYAGVFVCGILFSYLYHGLIARKLTGDARPAWYGETARRALSAVGVVLLGGYLLLATDTLFAPGTHLASHHADWFGFAAGWMILLALVTPGTLYDRLLSALPLRALGLVGFSFYLLHPLVLDLLKGMADYYFAYRLRGPQLFMLALVVTYFLAAFTYSYIERPFLKKAQRS